MNYLELVDYLMDMGLDEDTACREAYAELFPESYDSDDYYEQEARYEKNDLHQGLRGTCTIFIDCDARIDEWKVMNADKVTGLTVNECEKFNKNDEYYLIGAIDTAFYIGDYFGRYRVIESVLYHGQKYYMLESFLCNAELSKLIIDSEGRLICETQDGLIESLEYELG